MRRLVREASVGSTLVYTVERGDQRLQIAVPTMEFIPDILLRFIPGWLLSAILCLAIGIFVYVRNPTGRLNRYLLLYLLLWAYTVGAWEVFLSQQKWTALSIPLWMASANVAGWIFFWSFPADRARKAFPARWPLIPAFAALAVAATVYFSALFFLASLLDRPGWWRLYTLSATWGSFLIFGGGTVLNKTLPPLQIILQDIRRLIHDLRPAALDELGLVPALREYVARYQGEQGLEVALALPALSPVEGPEGDKRLSAPLETALFRVIQEALANVARHAQARRVEVAMTRDRRGVTLRVADDGRGFDPGAPRPGTHLGLWSMREWVEQLGGQFEVESAPGAGTTVRAVIPLGAQE
jgi:hypothetical protein